MTKRPRQQSIYDATPPAYRQKLIDGWARLLLECKTASTTTIDTIFSGPHIGTARDFENAHFGAEVREDRKQGGSARGAGNIVRDIEMAREYRQRSSLHRTAASPVSNTEIARRIGEKYGLKKQAAIEAIKRGLSRLK